MDFFADFDFVDVITSGAIGEPGRRTFYIQARAGARTVTIRSEKQQVAAIGKYLRRALAHSRRPTTPIGHATCRTNSGSICSWCDCT